MSVNFDPKQIDQNRKFRPNFFGSKLAEMKTLLCKWRMAIKTYTIYFYSLIIEKFEFQVKMPPEKEAL